MRASPSWIRTTRRCTGRRKNSAVAEIDLHLVREFFELNRFKVFTHWPQHDRDGGSDSGAQLYVENGAAAEAGDMDPILQPAVLSRLHRAVVEMRPWHTDRFYASLIEANPVLTQFAEPWSLGHAQDFFGSDDFRRILVISELPRTAEQRAQLVQRLAQTSVDHVLEFPAILHDLAERTALSGTYTGSPTLQLLQHLKRYRLLRNQQLELSFPREPRPTAHAPRVDATPDRDELRD